MVSLLPLVVFALDAHPAGPVGVSVLDFQPDPAFPQQAPAAAVLTELLTADLARLHPGVLDRSAIRRVIEEQRMAAGGLTSADVLRLSRVAGVRYFIRGTVSPGAAPGSVCAHARLFDSETAETLAVMSDQTGGGSDMDSLVARLGRSISDRLGAAIPTRHADAQGHDGMTPESAATLARGLQSICASDPWRALGHLVDAATASPDHPAPSSWLAWVCVRDPILLSTSTPPPTAGIPGESIDRIAVLQPLRIAPSSARVDGMAAAQMKPTETAIAAACGAAVLESGRRLIDMEDAALALMEQDLKLSGVMDAATTARYGRSLCPDAVLVSTVGVEKGRAVIRLNLLGLNRASILGAASVEVPADGSLDGLRTSLTDLLNSPGSDSPAVPPPGWRPIIEASRIGFAFDRPALEILDPTNTAMCAWIWLKVSIQAGWPIAGEPSNRLAPLIRSRARKILEDVLPDDPLLELVWGNFIAEGVSPAGTDEARADAMPAALPRARMYLRLACAHAMAARGGEPGWQEMARLSGKALEVLSLSVSTGHDRERAAPAVTILGKGADLDVLADRPPTAPATASSVDSGEAAADPERRRIVLSALAYRGRARLALGQIAGADADFSQFESLAARSPSLSIGIHSSMVLAFLAPGDPPDVPEGCRWIYRPREIGARMELATAVAGWKSGMEHATASPAGAPSTAVAPGAGAYDVRLAAIRADWRRAGCAPGTSMEDVRGILQALHRTEPARSKAERDTMARAFFETDTQTLRTRGQALLALKRVLDWYKATGDAPAGVRRLTREPLATQIDCHDLLYAVAQSPVKRREKLLSLREAEATYRGLEARESTAEGRRNAAGWRFVLDTIYRDMNAGDEVYRLGLETATTHGVFPVGFQQRMVSLAIARNPVDASSALAELLRERRLAPETNSLRHWWANSLQDILPRDRAPTRADYARLKAAVTALDRCRGEPSRDLHRAAYMIGLGESLEEAMSILREIAARGGRDGARASEMIESVTTGRMAPAHSGVGKERGP